MLTAWLLFILALAMVIGPVMMIRPTPGMKRVAKLRSLANQQGFTITIKPPSDKGRVPGAAYFLLRKKSIHEKKNIVTWRLEKKTHSHEIHFYGLWDWAGAAHAPKGQWPLLHTILDDIPVGVTELELNTMNVGCMWDETCGTKSEQESIDMLRKLLTRVMDVCA